MIATWERKFHQNSFLILILINIGCIGLSSDGVQKQNKYEHMCARFVQDEIDWLLYTLNVDGVLLKDVSYLYECEGAPSLTDISKNCTCNNPENAEFVKEVRQKINERVSNHAKFKSVSRHNR